MMMDATTTDTTRTICEPRWFSSLIKNTTSFLTVLLLLWTHVVFNLRLAKKKLKTCLKYLYTSVLKYRISFTLDITFCLIDNSVALW